MNWEPHIRGDSNRQPHGQGMGNLDGKGFASKILRAHPIRTYKSTCMPTQTQAIKPTFSQIGHEFDGPREFIAKKKGVWDLVAISR